MSENLDLFTGAEVSPFDGVRQERVDGTEFWSARELMPIMNYATWRNFEVPLDRAMASARAQGHDVDLHFAGSRKVIAGGRWGTQEVEDVHLTRFGAYLVAMNGDPNKPAVASAQSYFAVRTREAEVGARPALSEEEIVHQALQITARRVEALEAKVAEDAPKVDYHERFIAPADDVVTVGFFAGQFGTTEPRVRELMLARRVAVRREVGKHWSKSKGQMVAEFEWRAKAGPCQEWFDLRPQHNAPRLHNGQVRQTLYVRQFYAAQLAKKLGLTTPALAEDGRR